MIILYYFGKIFAYMQNIYYLCRLKWKYAQK